MSHQTDTNSEETITVSEVRPPVVTVIGPRLVVQHPDDPYDSWELSTEEAAKMITALSDGLRRLGAWGRPAPILAEREVVFMRTGYGQPEPTAAVKTWRRVAPIDGKPNMIARMPDGRYRIGERGEAWSEAHPIAHAARFGWNSLRNDPAIMGDVWVSTDEEWPLGHGE